MACVNICRQPKSVAIPPIVSYIYRRDVLSRGGGSRPSPGLPFWLSTLTASLTRRFTQLRELLGVSKADFTYFWDALTVLR